MKNYFIKKIVLLVLGSAIILSSCTKEPDDNNNTPSNPPVSTAIYILNQGLNSSNNASVTYYNPQDSITTYDYFKLQNDRSLGDVGNDLYIYGAKAYIVTNISSQLEIVDAVTFKSIQQISFIENTVPKQPSSITGFGGKIYVASFDGTVTVIDTTTLEKIKTIEVGLTPDGILAAYDKIWVSNSGGLNWQNGYDSTVSVIDPVTLTETDKIIVGTNPYTLQADKYGDIYVITRGDYLDKMRLKIIDAETKSVKHTFEDFEAYNFTIRGDTAYIYHYDFENSTSNIMMLNVRTEEIVTSNFITDGTSITTPYGIAADPTNDDIYICDAKGFNGGDGVVYCFNTDGKLKFTIQTGVLPFAVRFLIR